MVGYYFNNCWHKYFTNHSIVSIFHYFCIYLHILNILEKGETRGCTNGAWPYKVNCNTEKQFKENGETYNYTKCKCKSDLCNGSPRFPTGFGFFFYAFIYYAMYYIFHQFWLSFQIKIVNFQGNYRPDYLVSLSICRSIIARHYPK